MMKREGWEEKDQKGKVRRGAGPGTEQGEGKSGEGGGVAGEREASEAWTRGASGKEGEAWA